MRPAVRRAARAESARIVRTFARDVFAADAVAAGRAAHQPPVLVGQRNAQAVDLQLGDVDDRLVAEAGAAADPLVECPRARLVVGVVEAEHRREVLDRLESFDRPAGDALGRRVGRDEIGMLRLEPLELVQQPIELLVGDLRVVVDVVALFVVADVVAKLSDAGEGIRSLARFAARDSPLRPRTIALRNYSIPCEHVIRQRHQGVALAARGKRGKTALGAIRIFHGAPPCY